MAWVYHIRRRGWGNRIARRHRISAALAVPYWDWVISQVFLVYEMQALVAKQIEDFVKYPPRQKPASFNLNAVLAHLQDASGGPNYCLLLVDRNERKVVGLPGGEG